MPGPLDGIRILDFTRYQQGPYATVLLSDLGADIIKVEERNNGDLGRSLGLQPDGWCAYFEAHNRNKRSITVDSRKQEGQAILHRLVKDVDVVTDNFRPGVMKRFNLDYATLSVINPKIITASASGFGSEGPDAAEPSFDSIGQAMGGIMINQGGGPGNRPMSVMGGTADQVGAMVFALGICSALLARERTGIGQQHVDASLLGSQVALQALQITGFLRHNRQGPSPQRGNPVFTHYECSDGLWLTLGILDPKWWPRLCSVLDREDLVADPRFDAHGRMANRLALLDELDTSFCKRPRGEWLPLLKAADIPCGPVNDYAAMSQEPQVLANKYVTTMDHPHFGEIRVVGSPIRMTKTEVGPRFPAPQLGEHTEEILLAAGYTREDIECMKNAETI